jgi:hypothetical protein
MKFLKGDYLEKKRLGQISTTGINSISSVEKLIEDVQTVFHNSHYNAVKLQLSFHIIWEGASVEEKNVSSSSSSSSSDSLEYLSTIVNKRGYFGQDVYNVNIDGNLLITITYINW